MNFVESLPPEFRTPGDYEPNIAYFVARLGREGESWVQEYTRPEHVKLMAGANRALKALRERRIEEGRRELLVVESLFHGAASTTALEVRHMLGRWYYGLLAYYFYCTEEYQDAEDALDRGHAEVQQAIERKRFLLPYAMECYGFWIQRIRITCKQRRWPELWHRVEITRQIAVSERPCCVLGDGTAIDVAAVKAFYLSLEDLTDRERQPLREVLDATARTRQFRSIISEIYSLPGFVIPYTPARPPQQEAAP